MNFVLSSLRHNKIALCKSFLGWYKNHEPFVYMVGVTGIEPAAPASRRQCSTRLSYTPKGVSLDLINDHVLLQILPDHKGPLYR